MPGPGAGAGWGDLFACQATLSSKAGIRLNVENGNNPHPPPKVYTVVVVVVVVLITVSIRKLLVTDYLGHCLFSFSGVRERMTRVLSSYHI